MASTTEMPDKTGWIDGLSGTKENIIDVLSMLAGDVTHTMCQLYAYLDFAAGLSFLIDDYKPSMLLFLSGILLMLYSASYFVRQPRAVGVLLILVEYTAFLSLNAVFGTGFICTLITLTALQRRRIRLAVACCLLSIALELLPSYAVPSLCMLHTGPEQLPVSYRPFRLKTIDLVQSGVVSTVLWIGFKLRQLYIWLLTWVPSF